MKVFIDGHGKCEVWKLPKMSSPKQRKYRYAPESFTHPAKMHVGLCRKIIETFTKLGEVVLDPMCGVSTTQIEAALLGRNAVGIDLESEFIKTSKKNIRLLKKLRTLAPKGEAVVLKGDARKLSELLSQQADSIVFSPPYVNTEPDHDLDFQKKRQLQGKLSKDNVLAKYYHQSGIGTLPYGKRVDVVITSLPFGESNQFRGGTQLKQRMMKGNRPAPYSQSKQNIGNLSYGVDAVVFSPPFSEAEFDCKHGIKGKLSPNLRGRKVWESKHKTKLRKDNIGRLKHGQIDAIITSPPYREANRGGGIAQRGYDGPKGHKDIHRGIDHPLSDAFDNVSNMPYGSVDAIITSPPYSEQVSTKGDPKRRAERMREAGLNPKTIGNLGKETYLSAMLQVYAECFKVLKSGGLMVLVIKDFIRNKKVVRLDLDTKRLCEAVGFEWVDTKLFRLQGKSFWRVLYERKHPEVDTSLLKYEFVEVFQKPLEAFA